MVEEKEKQKELARQYFATQPPRGLTPLELGRREFQRGQKELGSEVATLSYARQSTVFGVPTHTAFFNADSII